MDITTDTEETEVIINITFDCGMAGEYVYCFRNNCDHPSYAGLVQEAIQTQLDEHIAKIRRDAYEQGWQDKTKRRKKRDFFGWGFSVTKMP